MMTGRRGEEVSDLPGKTHIVRTVAQGCGGSYGAQGRDRTTDTAIFSRMLYQLSYLGAVPA